MFDMFRLTQVEDGSGASGTLLLDDCTVLEDNMTDECVAIGCMLLLVVDKATADKVVNSETLLVVNRLEEKPVVELMGLLDVESSEFDKMSLDELL